MQKTIYLACVVFLFVFLFPVRALADNDFSISSNTTYSVSSDGKTQIRQSISIKNLSEFVYTPRYSISISYQDLGDVAVFNNAGPIPFSIKQGSDGKGFVIDITFKDKVVGINKLNNFSVSFTTNSIASKKGSIWEVTIPGVSEESVFDEYLATLVVPDSFGRASIIKPWLNVQGQPLVFDKAQLVNSGILILFGEKQIYDVSLKYHLANANLFPIKTEIALPPNTNYQDVLVKKMSESPLNVYQDDDGNWLAEYKLLPNEKKDITVDLQMITYASPKKESLNMQTRLKYLKAQKYWETQSSEIMEVAKTLKTPKEVYNFVVNTLTYDYNKVNTKNNRLGAQSVLRQKNNAVCLEFDDLFVAIMRAKGVPARSVEGYAYTQDERLRPRSLGEDILHAWPEYYDDETNTWVMVDPTWGDTTGGIDYFHTLDFDHLTFVRKGISSTYPIPAGGYKTENSSKDIHVKFAKTPIDVELSTDLSVILPLEASSFLPISGTVTLTNTGNVPVENKRVKIKSELPIKETRFDVKYLPPKGKTTYTLNFEKIPILTNNSYKVTILFDGKSAVKHITVRTVPGIGLIALGGGIVVGSIIFAIITIKTRRLFVQK